ncbi:hypothetical protein HDU76_007932, partial [Blyttiomyces sp. JEL0837]
IGAGLQISTHFVGAGWFLPLASLGFTFRGVHFAVFNACHATFTNYFAIRGNVGDLVGKNEAQMSLTYLLGLISGVLLITFVESHMTLLGIFLVLGIFQVISTFNMLRATDFEVMNIDKLVVLSTGEAWFGEYIKRSGRIHGRPPPKIVMTANVAQSFRTSDEIASVVAVHDNFGLEYLLVPRISDETICILLRTTSTMEDVILSVLTAVILHDKLLGPGPSSFKIKQNLPLPLSLPTPTLQQTPKTTATSTTSLTPSTTPSTTSSTSTTTTAFAAIALGTTRLTESVVSKTAQFDETSHEEPTHWRSLESNDQMYDMISESIRLASIVSAAFIDGMEASGRNCSRIFWLDTGARVEWRDSDRGKKIKSNRSSYSSTGSSTAGSTVTGNAVEPRQSVYLGMGGSGEEDISNALKGSGGGSGNIGGEFRGGFGQITGDNDSISSFGSSFLRNYVSTPQQPQQQKVESPSDHVPIATFYTDDRRQTTLNRSLNIAGLPMSSSSSTTSGSGCETEKDPSVRSPESGGDRDESPAQNGMGGGSVDELKESSASTSTSITPTPARVVDKKKNRGSGVYFPKKSLEEDK